MEHQEKDREQLTSFIRGLSVIEIFADQRRRLSITEVAAAASTTKATARRVLRSLVASGYADFDGHTFDLTPRVLGLGYAYLSSRSIIQLAEPVLRDLRAKVKLSALMSVLEGSEIVIVARAPGTQILSIQSEIGNRLPAYCTSMGRAILSTLPDDEVKGILSQPSLRPMAARTETKQDRLFEIVKQTKERGYSLVDQEIENGLVSMAIPVASSRDGRHYAVCVSAHETQVPATSLPDIALKDLREAVAILNRYR